MLKPSKQLLNSPVTLTFSGSFGCIIRNYKKKKKNIPKAFHLRVKGQSECRAGLLLVAVHLAPL